MARKSFCWNCKYYANRYTYYTEKQTMEKQNYGECRFNAPIGVGDTDEPFPSVNGNMWCRHHEMDFCQSSSTIIKDMKEFLIMDNSVIYEI